MKIKQINEEVVVAAGALARLKRAEIRDLVDGAKRNERRRKRLCTHSDASEKHQEMFIVLSNDVYIRPHKHLRKVESFQVLEGNVDAVFFDHGGRITNVIKMGDYASGHIFYYRLTEPIYHSLVVRSDYLVFKESTTGPFDRSETVYAPWSPEEKDKAAVKEFIEKLSQQASRLAQ